MVRITRFWPRGKGYPAQGFFGPAEQSGSGGASRRYRSDTVAWQDLAHDVLGATSADLFPAWALSQQQALDIAGISPPAVDLTDTELAASRWADQRDIAWILLIPSLAAAHTTTVIRPVEPAQLVPFTSQWNPSRAHTTAVARFVHAALTAELPPAWHTRPDHLRHRE